MDHCNYLILFIAVDLKNCIRLNFNKNSPKKPPLE